MEYNQNKSSCFEREGCSFDFRIGLIQFECAAITFQNKTQKATLAEAEKAKQEIRNTINPDAWILIESL